MDFSFTSDLQPFLQTQEKLLKKSQSFRQLKIGIPKEINNQEERVSLGSKAVELLVHSGHEVYVETGAGVSAGFSDLEYSNVGASIIYEAVDLFQKADTIIKIGRLSDEELDYLKDAQTLISAVHIGSANPYYFETLIEKNITAVGLDFLQSKDGTLPILRMMSEIAGVTSIHIASEMLSNINGGKGVLLGGIAGVPPAEVVVLGAGTVGYYATQSALALGANVKVFDEEIYKLRRLEMNLGRKIHTSVSQANYIADAVEQADVVIGAVLKKGQRTPILVTEEMVSNMKEFSAIVDVSIDHGGCFETSEVTYHQKPTYVKHGVLHYCVPNIPSRVSHTASLAISNILGPLALKIGEAGGVENLLSVNDGLKQGVYIYRRHITKGMLAEQFGLRKYFRDIDLLYAAHL